jgi:hypothetical protein
MTVAHKLILKTYSENKLNIPAQQVATIACIVFSLWLFILHLLPNLSYCLTDLMTLMNDAAPNTPLINYRRLDFGRLAPIVIQLVVVLLMMFKARQISSFLLPYKKPNGGETVADESNK